MKKSELRKIIRNILLEKKNILDTGKDDIVDPAEPPPPGPTVITPAKGITEWIPKDNVCWKIHEVLEFNEDGNPENYNSCDCDVAQNVVTKLDEIESTKSIQKLLSKSSVLRNKIKKYFK